MPVLLPILKPVEFDLHFSQGVSISHEDNEDCDSSHLTMHGDCPCGIPWNPSPDFHWISRLASRPCMELVQPLASGWSHLVIQALSKHAWNEMAYSGRLKFTMAPCYAKGFFGCVECREGQSGPGTRGQRWLASAFLGWNICSSFTISVTTCSCMGVPGPGQLGHKAEPVGESFGLQLGDLGRRVIGRPGRAAPHRHGPRCFRQCGYGMKNGCDLRKINLHKLQNLLKIAEWKRQISQGWNGRSAHRNGL